MREISHVYRTTCTTVTQPPGLGDYLRGSIALAILSYEKGFTLHLDLSHHPIGRYLIRNPSFSTHTTEITEFFNDRVSLLPCLYVARKKLFCCIHESTFFSNDSPPCLG